MWVIGVIAVVVVGVCVWALLLGGGDEGPFLARPQLFDKPLNRRGEADFQADLRNPEHETELL
jgi:hypothetical protein